jgi:septal ring factor EnvC (AmiA/AmiB activator)
VLPVIQQIQETRRQWKTIVEKVNFFQKFGRLPEEKPTRAKAAAGGATDGRSLAELRLEDKQLTTNISKYRAKLAERPDHKKAEAWSEDLAKMAAWQRELRERITDLTYATT